MTESRELPFHGLDENAALRSILEGTATETGARFFQALVKNLARALKTEGAWVTEYLEDSERLRSFAFWMDGEWIHEYEYSISGTPCARVIKEASILHVPENVVELYPGDPDLAKFHAVSYIGAPLLDVDGKVLGHLAVMDSHPLPESPQCNTIIRIFAARAAAEHQRLRAEAKVREREEKVGRLLDSAMDAIIELDGAFTITRVNAATGKVFGCSSDQLEGKEFTEFLTPEGRGKISYLAASLKGRPPGKQSLWVPDGFNIVCPDGKAFLAESTLSRFEMQRKSFYTLILRNVNDLLEAQNKIRSLTMETEYLKEEIKALSNFGGMIGQSEPFLRVVREIAEVAQTDATVLIMGETGTGKELVSRSIHERSKRQDKAMISINCAAIPSTLIESEFFGHEKGAFTGALSKREGRFALADGGTIFLDEIGELPLDVQAKLLRVLQEGEFEPLGSSKTRKVNVRVVAATNQNLKAAVANKTFREDLFYRLNVFPIEVPPLRERGEDVILLASFLAEKIAQRMGCSIKPLSPDCVRRLKSYDWPGNVRELQNVIERAVITSKDGALNLDRALPEIKESIAVERDVSKDILTLSELNDLERSNIIRALEKAGWRVSGEGGAAQLLGMNSSTLSSRMKALGIQRPRL